MQKAYVDPPTYTCEVKWIVAAVSVLALAGCAATPAPTPEETGTDAWSGAFDYQLGGGYEPADGVTIVARDRTDSPADGLLNICYVNGFQSQPQEADFWLNEHPDLLLRDTGGEPIVDENWPDEFLFDTSTEDKRGRLAEIIFGWIDGCAADGFQAVEFDNLDSFLRSDGQLDVEDNVALASALASRVHENFLMAGQKNAAELTGRGADIGFDFAVAEECYRWDECASYTDAYGEYVVNTEYTDDLRGSVEDMCADPSAPPLTIVRDRDLVTPDDPEYHYESC